MSTFCFALKARELIYLHVCGRSWLHHHSFTSLWCLPQTIPSGAKGKFYDGCCTLIVSFYVLEPCINVHAPVYSLTHSLWDWKCWCHVPVYLLFLLSLFINKTFFVTFWCHYCSETWGFYCKFWKDILLFCTLSGTLNRRRICKYCYDQLSHSQLAYMFVNVLLRDINMTIQKGCKISVIDKDYIQVWNAYGTPVHLEDGNFVFMHNMILVHGPSSYNRHPQYSASAIMKWKINDALLSTPL